MHQRSPRGDGLSGGLVFSALGDQLYIVALGWVAIGVFGPAAGYLGAARAGQQMLIGTAITGLGMLAVALVGLLNLSASAQGYAIAAASALSGFGGPLRDIPNVALRQMLVGRAGIAAASRAYLVNTYGGMLVAMMLAPTACEVLGPVVVMLICAGAYAVVVAYGAIRGVDDPLRADTGV